MNVSTNSLLSILLDSGENVMKTLATSAVSATWEQRSVAGEFVLYALAAFFLPPSPNIRFVPLILFGKARELIVELSPFKWYCVSSLISGKLRLLARYHYDMRARLGTIEPWALGNHFMFMYSNLSN